MCIILVVPKKHKLPSDDIIRQCFINNPDGCGLMYIHDNTVVIDKGIMDVTSAIERIKKAHEDFSRISPLVIHFRIGTSGKKKSPECCHPFPLTNDYRELYKLQTVCSSAIAHNGIIFQYEQRRSNLSDTMFFSKMLSGLTSPSMIKRALNGHNSSRFVYLNGNGNIIRTGVWVNHKGIFYSNEGYLEKKIINQFTYIDGYPTISCIGQSYLTEYEKNSPKINEYPPLETYPIDLLSDEEKSKKEKFQKWIDAYDL